MFETSKHRVSSTSLSISILLVYILANHRIASYPAVLLIQNTTTLVFQGQKEREDTDPVNHDCHLGLLLHPAIAVTPERLCLGVIDTHHWARKKLHHRNSCEKSRSNHRTPLKEKESYRWIQGYQKANEIAQQSPNTMVVSIADREDDIYDLYQEAQHSCQSKKSAYWLVRASANRRVLNDNGKPDNDKFVQKTKRSHQYVRLLLAFLRKNNK